MIHYTNIAPTLIKTFLFSLPLQLEDGSITHESGKIKRNSKVSFIDNIETRREVFNIINYTTPINLTDIEPLQYSEYIVGDEYGWHRDVHDEPYSNGLVRKVSFSTILNDDFWGGEFDIETKNPMFEKRYQTFESEEYNTIIFPSHMWHRVRPVKSGVRKSIVGWLLGRP